MTRCTKHLLHKQEGQSLNAGTHMSASGKVGRPCNFSTWKVKEGSLEQAGWLAKLC